MKLRRLLAGIVAAAMTVGMMSCIVLADEAENAPEETSVAQTTETKEKEGKEEGTDCCCYKALQRFSEDRSNCREDLRQC